MHDFPSFLIRRRFDELPIPALRLDVIERRAKVRAPGHSRGSRRPVMIAALVTTLIPLAAVGYTQRDTIIAAVRAQLTLMGAPTGAYDVTFAKQISLQDAKRAANFRLIPPRGLPSGAHLTTILRSNDQFAFHYVLGAHRMADVTIEKYARGSYYPDWAAMIETDDNGHVRRAVRLHSRAWITGEEVVIASSDGMSNAQFRAMQSTMGGRSAPTSPPRK